VIIGNHDTFFKNTNSLNSMDCLRLHDDHQVHIYEEPTEVDFDGLKCLMMPWICDETREQSLKAIQDTKAQILFGHLEIKGFEMHIGSFSREGVDASLFKKFDMAMSGHFHHKSDNGNIYYLGNPYQITWSDYKDPRGFHIFDTETTEMLPVHNPLKMFEKAFYDDTEETFETISNKDHSVFESKFVKVIVVNKENPYWFDTFLDKVHSNNPIHLQVVDDNKHMDLMSDDEIENIEDTLTILSKYIDGLEIQGKKKPLNALMTSLYNEALEEHTYI